MKLVRDTAGEELAARYSLILPFTSVAVCAVLLGMGQLLFHQFVQVSVLTIDTSGAYW
jgi:hypothetical protein